MSLIIFTKRSWFLEYLAVLISEHEKYISLHLNKQTTIITTTKHFILWTPCLQLKKIYILNKKLRKLCFCQRLYPNQIQINEQTTAWVDRFQQNIQSFTVLNPFLRPLSFGLIYMPFNVDDLLFHICLYLWSVVSAASSPVIWSGDSVLFQKMCNSAPPLHHITVKTQTTEHSQWRWKSSNNDRFSNTPTAPCEQTGSPALKQTEQYFIFNVESTTESPQKINLSVAYV